MGEKLLQNKTIRVIGIIIGAYFMIKYLVPLIIPFLIAGYLAWMMRPFVRLLHRKLHINESLLASIFLLMIGGSIGLVLWIAIVKICEVLTDFLCNLDSYKEGLIGTVRDCCCRMEAATGIQGDFIEDTIMENATVFVNNLQITYLPKLMNHSVFYVTNILKVIGTIMIIAIATVFFIKDFDKIVDFLHQKECTRKMLQTVKKVSSLAGVFLKAQLIIMSIVTILVITVLLILGVKGAIGKGILIGILDALPFIGTALILFPWAVFDLLNGAYYAAIAKIILFLLCAILRDVLEPKLMSKKIGVLPILMVMSVYIGIQVFGISGIFIGPILLLLVVEAVRF